MDQVKISENMRFHQNRKSSWDLNYLALYDDQDRSVHGLHVRQNEIETNCQLMILSVNQLGVHLNWLFFQPKTQIPFIHYSVNFVLKLEMV